MPLPVSGDTYNTTVNGLDPKKVTDRLAADRNAAYRRNTTVGVHA